MHFFKLDGGPPLFAVVSSGTARRGLLRESLQTSPRRALHCSTPCGSLHLFDPRRVFALFIPSLGFCTSVRLAVRSRGGKCMPLLENHFIAVVFKDSDHLLEEWIVWWIRTFSQPLRMRATPFLVRRVAVDSLDYIEGVWPANRESFLRAWNTPEQERIRKTQEEREREEQREYERQADIYWEQEKDLWRLSGWCSDDE